MILKIVSSIKPCLQTKHHGSHLTDVPLKRGHSVAASHGRELLLHGLLVGYQLGNLS